MCGVVKYIVAKEVEISMALLILALCSGDAFANDDMLSTILNIIDEGALCEPKVKIKLNITVLDGDTIIIYESETDGIWPLHVINNSNQDLVYPIISRNESVPFSLSRACFLMANLTSKCLKNHGVHSHCASVIIRLYRMFQDILPQRSSKTFEKSEGIVLNNFETCESCLGQVEYGTVETISLFHHRILDNLIHVNSATLISIPRVGGLTFSFKFGDSGSSNCVFDWLNIEPVHHFNHLSSQEGDYHLSSQEEDYPTFHYDLNVECLWYLQCKQMERRYRCLYLIEIRRHVHCNDCTIVYIRSNGTLKISENIIKCLTPETLNHSLNSTKIPKRCVLALVKKEMAFSAAWSKCGNGTGWGCIVNLDHDLKRFKVENGLCRYLYYCNQTCQENGVSVTHLTSFNIVEAIKNICIFSNSKCNIKKQNISISVLNINTLTYCISKSFYLFIIIICIIYFIILSILLYSTVNIVYHKTIMFMKNVPCKSLLKCLKEFIWSVAAFYHRILSIVKVELRIHHRNKECCFNVNINCQTPLEVQDSDKNIFSKSRHGKNNRRQHHSVYNPQFPDVLNSDVPDLVNINSVSMKQFFGRSYLLSLGDIQRPSFVPVYPVFKNTLDKLFENNVDVSSNDSSMSFELLRVGTYSTFPGIYAPSSLALAKAGFYFTGESDTVECFHCHTRYNNWNATDDPCTVHRRISPTCGFINGQTDLNVPVVRSEVNPEGVEGRTRFADHRSGQRPNDPINHSFAGFAPCRQPALSQNRSEETINEYSVQNEIRNQPRNCVFGHEGTTELERSTIRPADQLTLSGKQEISTNRQTEGPKDIAPGPIFNGEQSMRYQPLKLEPLGIVSTSPRYPAYAVLSVRMSTFRGWPPTSGQSPKQMAIAGFIFAGYSDYTRCFFCGGGLRNWEPEDDPWIEQAKWFPKCIYVRQNKGDNFVQLVHQNLNNPAILQPNEGSVGNGAYGKASVQTSNGPRLPSRPIIKSVQEMGYDLEVIDAAIAMLRNENKDVDAYNIVDTILSNDLEKSANPPLSNVHSQNQVNSQETQQITTERQTDPQATSNGYDVTGQGTLQATVVSGNNEANTTFANSGQELAWTALDPNTSMAVAHVNEPFVESVQEMGYSRKVIDAAVVLLRKDQRDVNACNVMDVILSHDLESSSSNVTSIQFESYESSTDEQHSVFQATGSAVENTSALLHNMNITDIKSLVEENKSLKESLLCKICLDNEASIVFVPCGHLVCCTECSFAMRKCPICRKSIEGCVKTWMA